MSVATIDQARSAENSDERTSSRRWIMACATSVALISTAAAYWAMTGFGRDVVGMGRIDAYAFAGVFELMLVGVALMAREAVQHNRPAPVLLTLTWVLSALSGTFSAWHELYMGHAMAAAVFRFCVPLLAALAWHLALIGDRHLAMNRSLMDIRADKRIHTLMLRSEQLQMAIDGNDGTTKALRVLAKAHRQHWRARAIVTLTVPTGSMDQKMKDWSIQFDAVDRGVTRRMNAVAVTPEASRRSAAADDGGRRRRSVSRPVVLPKAESSSKASSRTVPAAEVPAPVRPAALAPAPAAAPRAKTARVAEAARPAPVTSVEPRRALNLLAQGVSHDDVAEVMGVPVQKVLTWSDASAS